MFQKNERLTYWHVLPQRVERTTRIKGGEGLIGGRGACELICSAGEASLLVDFHEEVVGGLELTVECTAAAHVTVIYEENADAAMRTEPYACSWYRQLRDEYDLEAGAHTLVSQGRRGFRFAGIFVRSEKNVRLSNVEAINGGWRVEKRGSFRCSDERLNRIWDISAATARACMQDFYEDGVKRDGLLWIGDYRLTFLAAWAAFGEAELARKSLLMIRDSQYECGGIPACAARGGGHQHDREDGIRYMPSIPWGLSRWVIPNYLADYICAIEEDIARTGDESILPDIMDSAEKTAKFMLTLTDMETPGTWWIDEYETKHDANNLRYTIHHDAKNNPKINIGSKGALLLEMLMALMALSKLAQRAKNDHLLVWSIWAIHKLDMHIEAHYCDAKTRQYTDKAHQNPSDVMGLTAVRAVLCGKKDERGMERLKRMIMPNIGFSMSWRIEAMMKAGYVHEALADMKSAWGKMLDADSLTCWERLDLPEMDATHYYDAPGSWCHGWTAGPAWELPKWIAGVHGEADCFKRVRIEPKMDTLDWAEATVPTPSGEIWVRAEKCAEGLRVTFDLPEGVEECTVCANGRSEMFKACGLHEVIF